MRRSAVYHGPFLNGFHLSDAEEFEHWADGERSPPGPPVRSGARAARGAGDARRQTRCGPSSGGRASRARIPTTPASRCGTWRHSRRPGDRAGALRHANAHSDLLRADLDAAPEREVIASLSGSGSSRAPPTNGAAVAAVDRSVRTGGKPEPHAGSSSGRGGTAARRDWVAGQRCPCHGGGARSAGRSLSRARAPALAAPPGSRRALREPHRPPTSTTSAPWPRRLDRPRGDGDAARRRPISRRCTRGRAPRIRWTGAPRQRWMVVRGSYYLSGDSVLFQAGIMDVAQRPDAQVVRSGRCADRACDRRSRGAAGADRRRSRPAGQSCSNRGSPSIPTWSARRASRPIASSWPVSRGDARDWGAEAEHYRRAARLDSTFVAPLIQLAFGALDRRVRDHGFGRRRARASPGAS